MEKTIHARTKQLIGMQSLIKLQHSRVIIFGAGGVGSFAIEALARSGVGTMTIVDYDKVEITNLNRQLGALHSTLGRYKADVMAERVRDINPAAKVRAINQKLTDETAGAFSLETYDYIADAVDDVRAKVLLIVNARKAGVPILSSMGAGNKLDPSGLTVADIRKTHTCPLAKKMRRELSLAGIEHAKVVFSPEHPNREEDAPTPASMVFVPGAAGLMLAAEIVRDLVSSQ